MRINHVGYLVGNIEESIEQFSKLGYRIKDKIIIDEVRRIKICFIQNKNYCIELIAPIDEMSVVYHTYKKLNEGPYHICYEVEDIEKSILSLKAEGYIQTQPVEEAVAFNQCKIAFLYHKRMGLIELVEIRGKEE